MATQFTDATGQTIQGLAGVVRNVLQWSAMGDGVADDAPAINKAIASIQLASITGKGQLIFPFGRYLIASPIVLASGIALIGERTHPNYGYQPDNLLTAQIIADPSFPDNEPMIDARHSLNTVIEGLCIVGNGIGATFTDGIGQVYQSTATTIGIAYGTAGLANENTVFSRHVIQHCSIVGHKKGVWAKEATYHWWQFNNFACNAECGAHLDRYCGDSTLIGNNFNTHNYPLQDITPLADYNKGVGLIVGFGTGQSNVIGGKIEYNGTGILLDAGTYGNTFANIQFDSNSRFHIHNRSKTPSDTPTFIANVSNRFIGCRFIGGGEYTDDATSCHVYLDGEGTRELEVDFIGCGWKAMGEYESYEYTPAGTRYPQTAIILAKNGGKVKLGLYGNDFFDAASNGNKITFDMTALDADSEINEAGNRGGPQWDVGTLFKLGLTAKRISAGGGYSSFTHYVCDVTPTTGKTRSVVQAGADQGTDYVYEVFTNAGALVGGILPNGTFRAAAHQAGGFGTGQGTVRLVEGSGSVAGFIEWRNPSDDRLGYIGFSPSDVRLVLENAAKFKITGGAMNFEDLTAERPLRLNANKDVVAIQIDLGSNADVKGDTLTPNQITKWDGAKLVTMSVADLKTLLALGISDISGLSAALAGKSDVGHTHTFAGAALPTHTHTETGTTTGATSGGTPAGTIA